MKHSGSPEDMDLTHFDDAGRARMVDISAKDDTAREALATGIVRMRAETLARIQSGKLEKGDVLAVAQVAGIMAAKQTPQVIPMCHTLLLTGVEIAFDLREEADVGVVGIEATVRTVGKTGAEMEALTAVSVAALTIYDMCKAIDKTMVISDIHLVKKTGGISGNGPRKPRIRRG